MNPNVDPWKIELIVVRGSHDGTQRSAVSRDEERGLLVRVRRGVYVERGAFVAMTPLQRHVVRMRALVAVTDRPVVFSHYSAAVVHALPILEARLTRLTTTVGERRERGQDGVSARLLPISDGEIEPRHGLLVTTPARTVVDVAADAPFEEGVMVADAALRRGLERDALHAALDLAGPRRGGKRVGDVIAFAHPGADSAGESRSRTTLLRLGVEPPELQHRLVLLDGAEVFLDMHFTSVDVGGEFDGAVKVLDPVMAPDAREALLHEKRREDAVRLQLKGLARWGWLEAGSTSRLGAVLARVGVLPAQPLATLADYAAAARNARPRRRSVGQR